LKDRREFPAEAPFKAVSRSSPCAICEGDHKCSVGQHGLILCGREKGPKPGFVYLGQAKGDEQFALYRREGDPLLNGHAHEGNGRGGAKTDWGATNARYVAALTDELLRALADSLGLPTPALGVLAIGYKAKDKDGPCYTFPEMLETREIIGIDRRYPDGSKKVIYGGKRGLIIPDGWRDRPGPVYVPEGPTDVLALTEMGLAAVGRPNNLGGVPILQRLFADLPADRDVIVLGEHDRKADVWPGRDGTVKAAAELHRLLGRPVHWALPPDGAKDARAWVVAQRLDIRESWLDAGKRFAAALKPELASAQDADLPEIVITTKEHEVNDQAEKALARDGRVYQRGGLLVRVVEDGSPAAGGIRRPLAPRIDAIPPATLREFLTANARWVTVQERGGVVTTCAARPPAWCVSAVSARAGWGTIRHLEAVVEYPVLRPDGTVLATPGYDPETGLLYQPARRVPDLLLQYVRDVRRARDELLDVVSDFPFAHPMYRAAWLAALQTPLARFAYHGPAPLFLVDSNVRGAGKGLSLDCIAAIVTDERFTVAPYTSDEDELRKRITSLAINGDRLVLFDNLVGAFGNATLDAALTATVWGDRLLGVNRTVKAPLFMTWYATGNNVSIAADTSRRVCHIRLESDLERPENRDNFRHPDLLAFVKSNRPRLLWAALALLRAFCDAGRPDQGLPAWGSFQGWSGLVRNAVVWLGLPDPGLTRIILQDQADLTDEGMRVLLACWERMDPQCKGLTTGEVVQRLFKPRDGDPWPDYYGEMRGAVETLLRKCDASSLSYKLRSHRRRIFGQRFIDKTGSDAEHTTRWAVFSPADFRNRPSAETSPASPAPPAATAPCPGDTGDAGDFPADGIFQKSTASGGGPEDSELL
jgi:hypothetical protein